MRDACEQCGDVVGGRSLTFVHMFSWSCVHLSRHCVDCVGYGLNAIVTVQQHGLCVVPFVVFSSVWGHSTEKTVGASGVPSMQDVGKALPATRLWQAGRSSQFAATPPMRTQMPRMLLVPRVNVVRKCLLICSGEEQANKTTHDHQ